MSSLPLPGKVAKCEETVHHPSLRALPGCRLDGVPKKSWVRVTAAALFTVPLFTVSRV